VANLVGSSLQRREGDHIGDFRPGGHEVRVVGKLEPQRPLARLITDTEKIVHVSESSIRYRGRGGRTPFRPQQTGPEGRGIPELGHSSADPLGKMLLSAQLTQICA